MSQRQIRFIGSFKASNARPRDVDPLHVEHPVKRKEGRDRKQAATRIRGDKQWWRKDRANEVRKVVEKPASLGVPLCSLNFYAGIITMAPFGFERRIRDDQHIECWITEIAQ